MGLSRVRGQLCAEELPQGIRDGAKVAALAALLAAIALAASAQAPLPTFDGYVTDQTAIMTAEATARLESKLRAFEQRTGSHVSLLIVNSTRPETMPDYARRVAIERAKTRTNPDNGAMLVVTKDKHEVHLEVSPALARTLTAQKVAIITSGKLPPAYPGSVSDGMEHALEVVMQVINAGPGGTLSTFTIRAPSPADRVINVAKFFGIVLLMVAALAAGAYGLRRSGVLGGDPRGPGTWPTPAPGAERRLTPYAIALMAINLVPLWGVVVHGWQVFAVFLLFWFENIVILLLGGVRLLLARPSHPIGWLLKPIRVPVAMLGPAVFAVAHGMGIMGIFAMREFGAIMRSPSHEIIPGVIGLIQKQDLGHAIAAIAAAHVLLFLWSYFLRGEWRQRESEVDLGMGRLVLLHFTIILGGFPALAFGSPLWALVVLLMLKIAGELAVHFYGVKIKPAE